MHINIIVYNSYHLLVYKIPSDYPGCMNIGTCTPVL